MPMEMSVECGSDGHRDNLHLLLAELFGWDNGDGVAGELRESVLRAKRL
jgi:hypothetical protein